MAVCQFCGAALPFSGRVKLSEECPACHRDLHSCRNCRFYDPTVNNQCREPQAEWVVDKERRNFCDFFTLAEKPFTPRAAKGGLDAQWDRMFGKKE